MSIAKMVQTAVRLPGGLLKEFLAWREAYWARQPERQPLPDVEVPQEYWDACDRGDYPGAGRIINQAEQAAGWGRSDPVYNTWEAEWEVKLASYGQAIRQALEAWLVAEAGYLAA